MEDELKASMSFKEFSEWAFKTGNLPYNQNDFNWSLDPETLTDEIMNKIYNKLQTKPILISTPKNNKNSFFKMCDETNFIKQE